MKHNKICLLALSIILALLVPLSASSTHAAGGAIIIDPQEGKIGNWVEIDYRGFDGPVRIYFSGDEADEGDAIGDEVTAYERISGDIFTVPDRLTDGIREEDVHGGDYYFYATYVSKKEIIAVARFTVIDGEIWLDPEEGTVGSELEISGEELRQNQKITVEYDGDKVDIISGDKETDSDGKFTCTVIIPESIIGIHTITVTDVSGNKPEAEFTVEPKITLDPTEQEAGKEVEVSGAGFSRKDAIVVTFDGSRISTTPSFIETDRRGSFNCSFVIPLHPSTPHPSYTLSSLRKVEAHDRSFNIAEAQLTVLAGINLSPTISPTSPGHAGMELIVRGTGFTVSTMVTITYSDNDDVIPVVTAPTDVNGEFEVHFTVPPSLAGSHVISATDGTTTVASTFTMESEAPPVPVPLLPEVAGTAEAEAYFDWEDVTDPSGVSYILQVASDADFTTIVLEKEGLSHSEYTVTEEERLEPTEKEAYFWRVKAVDSASNESEWALPRLFYVGFSWTSMPDWIWYTFYGLGVLLLVFLGFWVRKVFSK
jgi:hypothetical protein